MNASETTENSRSWVLKVATDTTVMLAGTGGWLLLTGWAYGYYFFQNFGIGLSAIELRSEDYAMYGFLVLRAYWLVAIGLIVGIGIAQLIVRRSGWIMPRGMIGLFLAIAVFGTFTGGILAAADHARDTYAELIERDYPGYRRIQVLMAKDWPDTPESRRLANGLGQSDSCYRIIFADSKFLFVFKPVKEMTALEPPVLALPRARIAAYRTRRSESSCSQD